MSFTLHQPAPISALPEFDCIFCNKPALRSSEAGSTATTCTVEAFCRHCGARKTMTVRIAADGEHWESTE
jgi:transcription elongation factor Elf1